MPGYSSRASHPIFEKNRAIRSIEARSLCVHTIQFAVFPFQSSFDFTINENDDKKQRVLQWLQDTLTAAETAVQCFPSAFIHFLIMQRRQIDIPSVPLKRRDLKSAKVSKNNLGN